MPKQSVGTDSGQYLGEKYKILLLPDRIFPYEQAVLHKADAGWYIDYQVFSVKHQALKRRKKIVSGKNNHEKVKLAKSFITEINYLLANGGHIDPIKELRKQQMVPLIVALDDYMREKRRTLKEQSVTTYEKWCRYFLAYLEHYNLMDMNIYDFDNENAADLRQFALENLKLSNKPYNVFKGYVSGFFNYSKPIYKLGENPIAATLHNLPTKTSKHIAYNSSQIAEYKQACEKLDLMDLWFFVRVIYYTFCRPGEEVRRIKIGDIKEKHIVIYAENSKTNHRTVLIPTPLKKVFQELGVLDFPPHFYLFSYNNLPGKTLVSKNYFYERHIKVMKKMDLVKQGYDIYGWKHTGVSALYKETKDLMLVKEQCGHSDITQTVQYLRDLGVFHYSTEINRFPEI